MRGLPRIRRFAPRAVLRALLAEALPATGLRRDAIASVVLHFGNAGFSLVTAVIFARLLGVAEFGAYTAVFAMATLLAVFGRFGIDAYLTRELSIALHEGNWPTSLGLLTFAALAALVVPGALAASAAALFLLVDPPIDQRIADLFVLGCLLIPVFAWSAMLQAILRSAGRATAGNMIQHLVRPLLLIASLAMVHLLGRKATGADAIVLHLVSWLAAVALMAIVALRSLPTDLRVARPQLRLRETTFGSFRFLVAGGVAMLVTHTDLVMLGVLATSEETGLYRVASRVASVIPLSLLAISIPLGPRLAVLYREGDSARLVDVYAKGTLLAMALGCVPFGAFVLYGREILGLFGPEFSVAEGLLLLLSAVMYFEVCLGPVSLAVGMVGRERTMSLILAGAAILNVVLNAVLIPRHGALGAACATALTMVLWKGSLGLVLLRRTGAWPAGFGLLLGGPADRRRSP